MVFHQRMIEYQVRATGNLGKVWSKDYSQEFEATLRIVIGIDNHRNLYEINFSKKKAGYYCQKCIYSSKENR